MLIPRRVAAAEETDTMRSPASALQFNLAAFEIRVPA